MGKHKGRQSNQAVLILFVNLNFALKSSEFIVVSVIVCLFNSVTI